MKGKLKRDFYLKNLTKILNYGLLREIDPHQSELKLTDKLDCVMGASGDIKGCYSSSFGPFMWPLPLNYYDMSTQPEYWYVLVTYGLLKGQVFEKFKVLKNKMSIDPATLTLESMLGNAKIFKLASLIRENELYDKAKLMDGRGILKKELLALVKGALVDKIDKVYDKLFS